MLISEQKLPKNKRLTASKEELIAVIDLLERLWYKSLDDGMFNTYQVNAKKLNELNESIEKLKINISDDKDDKLFERWLKFIEKQKAILEAQVYLKENCIISEIQTKEAVTNSVKKYTNN